MIARADRRRSGGPENRQPALAGFSPQRSKQRREAESRFALMLFAVALIVALGAVLMLIGSGSGHAVPAAPAALAKDNGWVGMAAVTSVLVSAVGGVAFLHRHFTSRRR
jgi:hypothetical protein